MSLIGQQLSVVLVTSHTFQPNLNLGRVPIQGLHPSEEHLRHKAVRRLSQSEGSSRCSSFSLFFEDAPHILPSIPLWNHRSQDSLCPSKIRMKERNRRHYVTFVVTQPGNAPKAGPSHLTTADEVTRSLWRTRLQRPQRPSPSEDADPELTHSLDLRSTHWVRMTTLLWPSRVDCCSCVSPDGWFWFNFSILRCSSGVSESTPVHNTCIFCCSQLWKKYV